MVTQHFVWTKISPVQWALKNCWKDFVVTHTLMRHLCQLSALSHPKPARKSWLLLKLQPDLIRTLCSDPKKFRGNKKLKSAYQAKHRIKIFSNGVPLQIHITISTQACTHDLVLWASSTTQTLLALRTEQIVKTLWPQMLQSCDVDVMALTFGSGCLTSDDGGWWHGL